MQGALTTKVLMGMKLKMVSNLQVVCDQHSHFFCSLVLKATLIGAVLALFDLTAP